MHLSTQVVKKNFSSVRKNIELLQWSLRNTDLSFIDSSCGELPKRVYKTGRHYISAKELRSDVTTILEQKFLEQKYLKLMLKTVTAASSD